MGPFSITLKFWMTLNPYFKVTPLLDVEYISTVRHTQLQWNTNRDLHTPYSTASFRMNFEWLSEIFNDRKHSAISLRQPSYSFYTILHSTSPNLLELKILSYFMHSSKCHCQIKTGYSTPVSNKNHSYRLIGQL